MQLLFFPHACWSLVSLCSTFYGERWENGGRPWSLSCTPQSAFPLCSSGMPPVFTFLRPYNLVADCRTLPVQEGSWWQGRSNTTALCAMFVIDVCVIGSETVTRNAAVRSPVYRCQPSKGIRLKRRTSGCMQHRPICASSVGAWRLTASGQCETAEIGIDVVASAKRQHEFN